MSIFWQRETNISHGHFSWDDRSARFVDVIERFPERASCFRHDYSLHAPVKIPNSEKKPRRSATRWQNSSTGHTAIHVEC
jgi:hypothetical protein